MILQLNRFKITGSLIILKELLLIKNYYFFKEKKLKFFEICA